MPEIEDNADLAMVGQLVLLKTRDNDFSILLDNGKLFTRRMLLDEMKKLKEIHAETLKTFDEFQKAIDRSPEIPQAMKAAVRQRIYACGQMRFLAGGKTNTEEAFRKYMLEFRAASRAAVKKFDEVYKVQLDSIATKAAVRK